MGPNFATGKPMASRSSINTIGLLLFLRYAIRDRALGASTPLAT